MHHADALFVVAAYPGESYMVRVIPDEAEVKGLLKATKAETEGVYIFWDHQTTLGVDFINQ